MRILTKVTLSTLAACATLLMSCAHGTDAPAGSHSYHPPDAGEGETGGSAGHSGNSDAGQVATCGNGVTEAPEACDKGDLGGHTCQTEHFAAGNLACTASCTLDTSTCNQCGDNEIQQGEECDGDNLGDKATCADLGLGKSTELLSCGKDCKLDMSTCSGCGDGTIHAPEDCEPHGGAQGKANLGGKTCQDLGWETGSLGCDDSCRFDQSGCSRCGDAKRSGVEECDGADFGGKECKDFTASNGKPFVSGTLSCGSDCKIDVSNCMICGDGHATGNESCDGADLKGTTCEKLQFTAGKLSCRATCDGFNTSGCSLCGNGKIEVDEQCDGFNLGSKTCKSLGFIGGGSLACSSSCVLDTSGCTNNTCGDGAINGSDACDCGQQGSSCTTAQLGGKRCQDLPSPAGGSFSGGTLSCNSPSNCTYDTSACEYCGDGTKNGTEPCDKTDLGGKTCGDLGFYSGSLSCTSSCQFDTSACKQLPNPLKVCSSPNVSIPDDNPTGVTDMLTISDSRTIDKVEVTLDIVHSWVGDIQAVLAHGSVSRTLLDRPGYPSSSVGCDGEDIDVKLSDGASQKAEDTCDDWIPPAIYGTRKPSEALAGFAGQDMSGTWSLRTSDLITSDTGTLRKWCILVTWH